MALDRLGPYQLEKLLGRGGMGAVYVGLHAGTGQRAAVKLLSAHLADDVSFRERFKQEIETLKRLLHPNIVQLHGYGEEEGHLYYVMELVEGRSLQEELAAGRRFAWRDVARIGIAVAQALKHAHDRGIIHRDLKPANLLIDAQDHIKLADFGIAKLYGGVNVTADGGVLGTADYMAPEQAEGKPPTTRCDLYSLGSVLFALLTGRPPFTGRTMVEVLTALQKQAPVPVRRLAPDTPAEFEQIIAQLLEKDPQKRIPTALALANRLKAMEYGLSLETRVHETELEDGSHSPPSAEALPPAAKTAVAGIHSKATVPLDDEDQGRPAKDEATLITGPLGAAAPASNTKLATQAGRRTGADSASDSGTDVSAGRPSDKLAADVPQPRVTQFTTVSEDDLRPRIEAEDSPHWQWLLAGVTGLAGLVLIGGAVYFSARPPSADRLYGEIAVAAKAEEPESLSNVEAEMTRFLQLYPHDDRAAAVQGYVERLEQYRLEKKLALRSRRGESNGLSPVERAYQQAMQLASTDPAAALARLEALVAVFDEDGDPSSQAAHNSQTEPTIALARQQIQRLRPSVEIALAAERQLLERQLERAGVLASSDQAAAKAIWRGIITLYQDKPWAQNYVAAAERGLAESAADRPR